MKDINLALDGVVGFIAKFSDESWDYHLWGFQHPDRESAIYIVEWVREMTLGSQAIFNISKNAENPKLYDVQIINVEKTELIVKKGLYVTKTSLEAIKKYRALGDIRRILLIPFAPKNSGLYATPGPFTVNIEIIPHKLLLS